MKSKGEIKKIVDNARNILKEIYEKDERLKNPKNQVENSGLVNEMNIVFKEILSYMLNN